MVELFSEHPARLTDELRVTLSKLSFGSRGFLREYILDYDWTLNDRVFWLEKNGKVFAWAVRAQDFPYAHPAFMVYVKAHYRKKGWGTFLYREVVKRNPKRYEVYGTHAKSAARFYSKLGREDYS